MLSRVPGRRLLFPAVIAVAGFLLPAPGEAGERRPSIVFFLIDDLGWMDLHCQGNDRLDTPHIDRLAAEGMRFTDAYAAAPVCSPTRAAILTGEAPARLRITNHIPDRPGFMPEDAKLLSADTRDRLAAEYVTVAERLKAAGYATAFLGKWHLAGRSGKQGLGDTSCYPERQGFDVNLGGCAYGGPPTYFDPYRIHNLADRREGEYLPDRLADEAVSIIREKREGPFLLFLWHYTVHWPMEAPQALIEKYEKRKGPGLIDARYGAMIEALDNAVGRILAALEEQDLTRSTLVIFTSDNGGYSGVADNRPLRRGKGYLYEGGIRVPLIVRWPGVVKPGIVCREPVVSTDFHPTLLAAAGLSPQEGRTLDGKSIMPLLTGSGSLGHRAIFFHFPNYAWHGRNRLGSAVREGDHKLIHYFDDDSIELYDVRADPGETRDISAIRPEKAAELRKKLERWLAGCNAAIPERREP